MSFFFLQQHGRGRGGLQIALVVIAAVAILLLALTLFSPFLGGGRETDFFAYRLCGLRRSERLLISLALLLFPSCFFKNIRGGIAPFSFLVLAFMLPVSPRFFVIVGCSIFLFGGSFFASRYQQSMQYNSSQGRNVPRPHHYSQGTALSTGKHRLFVTLYGGLMVLFVISIGEVFLRHHPLGKQYVYYSRYQARPIRYFGPYGMTLAPNFEDQLYNDHV